MIRATTNGVLRSYRRNLMHSFTTLNSARDTVLTQRSFNSYAEDPAAASQAFQLRRSFLRTSSQYTVSEAVIRKYDTAWSSLESVVNMVDNRTQNSSWSTVIQALDDPKGEARVALGQQLEQLSESIVQTMNAKYGDTFTFAGADGLNVPFEWKEGARPAVTAVYKSAYQVQVAAGETLSIGGHTYTTKATETTLEAQLAAFAADYNTNAADKDDWTASVEAGTIKFTAKKAGSLSTLGASAPADTTMLKKGMDEVGIQQLYYRGVPVDTMVPAVKMDETVAPPVPVEVDANGAQAVGGGFYLKEDGTTISVTEYDKLVEDKAKLDYMLGEKNYVDIGLGLQEDENGELIESSAFNMAFQGITFLGYGVDADGDPKNIATIIRRMGEICSNFKDGDWAESSDYAELNRLAGKLQDASEKLRAMHVDMDAEASFLKDNHAQLENTAYTLNEQFETLESVDLADAITSFSWAQYCYNAALKVGNSILSQSLMDYMN